MRLLSALAFAAIALASPALAGPAEKAFLAKLPGTWTGTGTVTGLDSAGVTCTLTLTGSDKINFAGQCDAGSYGPQSYKGVLTYDDAAKKYVARSANEIVVGTKSGNAVVFKFPIKTIAGPGKSVMSLSANTVQVNLTLTREDTGEKITSNVTFKKQG